MIKKTITFHDFEGDKRTDDFYFSLNQVQFAKLNRLFPGGLQAYMEKIAKDKNVDELLRVIDILVSEAYGERSGNAFVKVAPNGQKYADFFVNTEAYDNLLTELLQNNAYLIEFLTGCLPQDAQVRARAGMAKFQEKLDQGATPEEAMAELQKEQAENT